MDEAKAKELAREAGREAVREMMLTLGMDVSTPEGVQRAQRNFAFLDDMYVGAQAVKRKTFLTIVGTVVAGTIAYMAMGFKPH